MEQVEVTRFLEELHELAVAGATVEEAERLAREHGILDLDLLGRAFSRVRQHGRSDEDESVKRLIAALMSRADVRPQRGSGRGRGRGGQT